jgi:hypothetical protein
VTSTLDDNHARNAVHKYFTETEANTLVCRNHKLAGCARCMHLALRFSFAQVPWRGILTKAVELANTAPTFPTPEPPPKAA